MSQSDYERGYDDGWDVAYDQAMQDALSEDRHMLQLEEQVEKLKEAVYQINNLVANHYVGGIDARELYVKALEIENGLE